MFLLMICLSAYFVIALHAHSLKSMAVHFSPIFTP